MHDGDLRGGRSDTTAHSRDSDAAIDPTIIQPAAKRTDTKVTPVLHPTLTDHVPNLSIPAAQKQPMTAQQVQDDHLRCHTLQSVLTPNIHLWAFNPLQQIPPPSITLSTLMPRAADAINVNNAACARTRTDVSLYLPTFAIGRVERHVLITLHLPNASFLLCTPLHESSPIIHIFVLQHPRAMVTRHGGLTTVVCRSTTVRSDASIFNLAPSLPLSYVGCRQFHQLPRATPTAHSNLICSAHFHGNFRQLITAYLVVSAYADNA